MKIRCRDCRQVQYAISAAFEELQDSLRKTKAELHRVSEDNKRLRQLLERHEG